MAKPEDPTRLQTCLTTVNKKIIEPAKSALKSDIVRQNITQPVKKLANEQSFLKEYITDPIANAATGRKAAELKKVANGAKQGVKLLSKPFLPAGLTERDCRLAKNRSQNSLGVGQQGPSIEEGWDEDNWSDDDDSHFKAEEHPKTAQTVIESKDANGQIHMSVVEDITDELRTEEEKNNDSTFRETDSIDVTNAEKVELEKAKAENGVRFQMSDMEFDRFENPLDIENFAKARATRERQKVIDFEPCYRLKGQPPGLPKTRERMWTREPQEGDEEEDLRRRLERGQTAKPNIGEEDNMKMVGEFIGRRIPSPPREQGQDPSKTPQKLGRLTDEGRKPSHGDQDHATNVESEVDDAKAEDEKAEGRKILEEKAAEKKAKARKYFKKEQEKLCEKEGQKLKSPEQPAKMFGSAEDLLAKSVYSPLPAEEKEHPAVREDEVSKSSHEDQDGITKEESEVDGGKTEKEHEELCEKQEQEKLGEDKVGMVESRELPAQIIGSDEDLLIMSAKSLVPAEEREQEEVCEEKEHEEEP